MIRIIKYECLKITRKHFIGLLLFLLIIQCTTVILFEYKDLHEPKEYYRLYHSIVQQYESNPNAYREYLDSEIEKINSNRLISDNEAIDSEARAIILYDLEKEYDSILIFPETIKEIVNSAENLSNISIFNTSKKSVLNISKTAKDYRKIADVKLHFGDHFAMKRLYSRDITFICLLILVTYIGVFFAYEDSTLDITNLVTSTDRGKSDSIPAKLFAMFFLVTISCVLSYLCTIILFHVLYGFRNMKDSIQSIPQFMDFTVSTNCYTTIIITIGIRIIQAISASFCVFALVLMLKKQETVLTVAVLFLLTEMLFCYLISYQSAVSILRYINVFTLLDLKFSVFQYNNFVFAGWAISMKTMTILMSILPVIASTAISLKMPLLGFYHREKEKRITLHHPHSLLIEELLISLLHWKGIITIGLLIVFLVYQIFAFHPGRNLTCYNDIIKRFAGPLDESKQQEINYIRKQITDARLIIDEAYLMMMRKEMSVENYYGLVEQNRVYTEMEKDFYLFQNEMYLSSSSEKQVVDYLGFQKLFDCSKGGDILNRQSLEYVVLITIIILLNSPFHSLNGKETMGIFYETTIAGRKQRDTIVTLLSAMFSVLIGTMYSLYKYLCIKRYYTLLGWTDGISNICDCVLLGGKCSISIGYITVSFIRILVLLASGFLVVLISKKTASLSKTLMLSFCILILPVFICYTTYPQITGFMPWSFFVSSKYYQLNIQFILKLSLYLIFIILLLIELRKKRQIRTLFR